MAQKDVIIFGYFHWGSPIIAFVITVLAIKVIRSNITLLKWDKLWMSQHTILDNCFPNSSLNLCQKNVPSVKNIPRAQFYKLRLMKCNQMFPHSKSLRELQTEFTSPIHVRPLCEGLNKSRLFRTERDILEEFLRPCVRKTLNWEGEFALSCYPEQQMQDVCVWLQQIVSTVQVCAMKRNTMVVKGSVMDVNWCPSEFLDFHPNCAQMQLRWTRPKLLL